MSSATVFYHHPHYGSGHYVLERSSAVAAGREAVDMIPEDLIDIEYPVIGVDGVDEENFDECVWDYESQCRNMIDELDVRVYAGRWDTEPTDRKPDWELV